MHAVAAFFASIIAVVSSVFVAPTVAPNAPVDIRATHTAAAAVTQTPTTSNPFLDPSAPPVFVPPPSSPSPQTVINQPVIERIIERVVPQGGSSISTEKLTAILTEFGQSIESRIAAVASAPIAFSGPAASTPLSTATFAPSQRIDQITNTAINTPTITGGTISGASAVGASSGSFDALSAGTLALSGAITGTDASFSGTLSAGTLNVAGLSSQGALIGPYFTATSTTATSSFAGPLVVGTLSLTTALSIANGGTGTTTVTAVTSVIQFLPNGAGAIARSVQSKLTDTVSVKDFGAVGDGVTDDTLAINAAITYANALGGGDVIVPPGTYMIDATPSGAGQLGGGIQMKSNVSLRLANGATLQAITNSLNYYHMIVINEVHNVGVYGGAIRGERTTHTASTGEQGMGIEILSASTTHIVGTYISNFWGDGIYISDNGNPANPSRDVHIDRIVSDNNRRQGLSAVNWIGGSITNSVFKNTNGLVDSGSGIDFEVNYSATQQNSGITISGNRFENNYASGLALSGPDGSATSSYMMIVGNTFTGNQWGIYDDVGRYNTIASNLIFGNRAEGIYLNHAFYETYVGNQVYQNNQTVSGTAPNIMITADSSYNTFSSNIITGSGTPLPYDGVRIIGSANVENTFTDNAFLGSWQNTAFNDSGTRTSRTDRSAFKIFGFVDTDGTAGGYKLGGNTVLYASTTNNALAVGASSAATWMSASSTDWSSIAIGPSALAATPTNGGATYNIAVGRSALSANSTGQYNSAFGPYALTTNTTGSRNLGFGYTALLQNVTGADNVVFGANALRSSKTGSANSVFGSSVGYNNTSATSTTLFGYYAGYGNGGVYNNQGTVAIGSQAGYNFQTGSDYNTLLGYQAGYGITTGTRNVLLGQSTIPASYNQVTTGSNNIAIGNDVAVPSATANNQLTIGNLIYGTGLDGTGSTVSTGNVGIGTTTPTAQFSTTGTVRFAGLGSAGANLVTDALGNVTASSDERLKDKQGDFTRGLAAINAISPVLYKWRPETGFDTQSTYAGFFAQNVQAAIPEAVSQDSRGYLTLADRPILAALVNATKEIGTIASEFKSSLIAWLGNADNGIGDLFAKDIYATNGTFQHLASDDLCLKRQGGTLICITADQLAALLGQSAAANVPPSVIPGTAPNFPLSVIPQAPVIELNGNASSTIELGDAYNDLGARIVAPTSDLNLGVVIMLDGATTTQVSIDTTIPAEHTILYTVTSPTTGLTGTTMRTVSVSPAAQLSEPPANDNPFNPAPANDNASSTTAVDTAA